MIDQKLRTALIGFGKVAKGYAKDEFMARHYRFATHAQVLQNHEAYDWQAVVDKDSNSCVEAKNSWKVPWVFQKLDDLGELLEKIDVVVIATPPSSRSNIIEKFPNLAAVIVEKPLGRDYKSAEKFVNSCKHRNLLVQVNYWRRVDRSLRFLADGELSRLIGKPQFVIGIYGNGIMNNATHIVDMLRMLFGEVTSVQRINALPFFPGGPIRGDSNFGFSLKIETGLGVVLIPVSFDYYRENGLSIWGTEGRLDILNEGLVIQHYPRNPNRALICEYEIANDEPNRLESGAGSALYEIYENLSQTLSGRQVLYSSGESALRTEKVVDTIIRVPLSGEECPI